MKCRSDWQQEGLGAKSTALSPFESEVALLRRLGAHSENELLARGIAAAVQAGLIHNGQVAPLRDLMMSVAHGKAEWWSCRWSCLRGGWPRSGLLHSAIYAWAHIDHARINFWLSEILCSRLADNVIEGWPRQYPDGSVTKTAGDDTYSAEDESHLQERVAMLESMPAVFWDELRITHGSWGTKLMAATNPLTPHQTLLQISHSEYRLGDDRTEALLKAVASHPNADDEIFLGLISGRQTPGPARMMVALNKRASTRVLDALAFDGFEKVRGAVASNPVTAPKTLSRIVASSQGWPRNTSAMHPNLPSDALRWLARCDDVEAVRHAAQNPALPADVLESMRTHPDAWVRELASRHPRLRSIQQNRYADDPRTDAVPRFGTPVLQSSSVRRDHAGHDVTTPPPEENVTTSAIGKSAAAASRNGPPDLCPQQTHLDIETAGVSIQSDDLGGRVIWPSLDLTASGEIAVADDRYSESEMSCLCGPPMAHRRGCMAGRVRVDKETLAFRRAVLRGENAITERPMRKPDWVDAVTSADFDCVERLKFALCGRHTQAWRGQVHSELESADAAYWFSTVLREAVTRRMISWPEIADIRVRSVVGALTKTYPTVASTLPSIDVLRIDGGLALVVPAGATSCTGPTQWLTSTSRGIRECLSRWLHIACVVYPDDPMISGDGTVDESTPVLVVASASHQTPRKRPSTSFVRLRQLPDSAGELRELAAAIIKNAETLDDMNGARLLWSAEQMVKGDWPPLQRSLND